ncbi:Hypermethylated in cancer 2 protein [Frankliniella fusca]|uniref:Hypermethylated in cancer 2 protein n=1 Tax=Frankliniella fusca TaxID=407009 RepID=A0AAE1LR17_9NEOP|nr:Hypermethylated in cancer 2 protein [Frankliniella fusca]
MDLLQSPYKKIKLTNKKWVAYVNLSKLDRNKAYKIEGLVETSHLTYGKGQQATIKSSEGAMYRTQLPGKYLANLKPDMIDFIKRDIGQGRNPYLVYREQMMDNSYRIDILEKSAENDAHFQSNSDVPEEPITVSDDEDDVPAISHSSTLPLSNDSSLECVDHSTSTVPIESSRVKTEKELSVPISPSKLVSENGHQDSS